MAKADLHTHTNASDGKLSAIELVQLAKKKKIDVLSITDHDTIDALSLARVEAEKNGITFINGIEITSDFYGREAHVLAYAFDDKSLELNTFLSHQEALRENRVEMMVKKLNDLEIDITYEQIKSISGAGSIGRPHIAKCLVELGYAKSMNQAFYKYIGNHAPAYFKAEHPDFKEVIKIIKRSKGKAIVAHPAASYSQKELDDWIYHGIDGFEIIHPKHQYALQKKFDMLCNEHDLIKTGGSDYHGFSLKDDVYFGVVTINSLMIQNLVHLDQENRQ